MANPFQGDDVDPFSGARDEEGNIPTTAAAEEAPKKETFGQAFKAARGRGDKTFEFMGKKYTTEMAGGKKPAASSPADSSPAKSTSYAEAAKSSKTLGDLMNQSTKDRDEFTKAVREGKEKTLGTKLQEFGGRFKRALMTGRPQGGDGMKKGGKVKKMAKGGSVSSASKRADGCAQRGKTRGRMV